MAIDMSSDSNAETCLWWWALPSSPTRLASAATLVALSSKLYSSGIKYIQCSTLAHINETKNWHIYHDFGQIQIAWARELYQKEPSRLDVDGIVYAFDSSTIKLCLQLCPWARLHHDKGGVKMHTLLDLRGSIPTSYIWQRLPYMIPRPWSWFP